MPSKISTICYIHDSNEKLTQEYTVKEITAVSRNVNGSYALEFYVEENLGDREPQQEFWVEVNHDPNIRNLSNKTNSINQSMRSTTAIIVSLIKYEPPVIDEMIANDVIRSTMLDSLYELELYAAVLANQIHTCSSKCQGPAPPGQTCKKGFPRPYSEKTHYVTGESRYVYKCLTEADSWVVPYHPAIHFALGCAYQRPIHNR
uniref:Uncharacterized protein n=1 Tax=Rhizophagus irregularis (strain DAOM 181602 / DAOM 197198 / MUCL 43194) TaxID=747089 RepID=U9TZM2_RHIID